MIQIPRSKSKSDVICFVGSRNKTDTSAIHDPKVRKLDTSIFNNEFFTRLRDEGSGLGLPNFVFYHYCLIMMSIIMHNYAKHNRNQYEFRNKPTNKN